MRFVHFIGMEGIGMSALAHIQLSWGVRVSGSDLKPGSCCMRLQEEGAIVYAGHSEQNIASDVDAVVYSAAVTDENPEFREAQRRGLRLMRYAEMLGELMDQKAGIAVAGCHGKTTTTGMTAYMLQTAGANPSFVIGGNIAQLGGNGGAGEGAYFVAEACEYKRSFMNLHPAYAIITNIEEDHLDYYRDLDEIKSAFADFASRLPENGLLVINSKAYEAIRGKVRAQVATYSLSETAAWTAQILRITSNGTQFLVKKHGYVYDVFDTVLPGRHNVANCLAVIALADHLCIPMESLQRAISTYRGARRRFDILQKTPFAVIDDYAHHPTEIKAVLRAAREKYGEARIWAVFQPHQASRTYTLFDEFAQAFQDADEVVIADIYYARDSEEDRKRVTSGKLAAAIRERGKSARHVATLEGIREFLQEQVLPGDIVICMGAGSITDLTHSLPQMRLGSLVSCRR